MNIIEYVTDVDVNLTCRQGTINTTYDKLVSILGEPTYVDMAAKQPVPSLPRTTGTLWMLSGLACS